MASVYALTRSGVEQVTPISKSELTKIRELATYLCVVESACDGSKRSIGHEHGKFIYCPTCLDMAGRIAAFQRECR